MYNMHCHSQFSTDGKQTLDEICQEAVEKGLSGVAITDHLNTRSFWEQDSLHRFELQYEAILEKREEYRGRLELFRGIEVGEYAEDPVNADSVLNRGGFDVVLGSCHAIQEGMPSFRKFLREDQTEEEVTVILNAYYDTMLKMASMPRFFDVLAHPTLPFRYLGRVFGGRYHWRQIEDKMIPLLEIAVKNDLALELNVNGWTDEFGHHTLPETDLLKIYYQMGGRLVTVGTDSHKTGRLSDGFDNAFEQLKEAGFHEYCCYRERKPCFYPIP